MARTHVLPAVSSSRSRVTWRPTKIMNYKDLSKDDDFLSHLLVEKVGTGAVPLLVHKMDPSRRLPKVDAQDIMRIVRRLTSSKMPISHTTRQAVDELLLLAPIRYYIKTYTQKQINAFATHALRYLELYNPNGYIEIAHTSRYSHRTGKSELCILATRLVPAGTVIAELKGSMANLTEEEDRELKRTDLRNCDVRRDFSVIHSKQMKKNHLFLGPARFVNHDCENNCELFREGRYITFRTLRPIQMGEEITAHYGDGYFGRKNRHCLCETCEKHGRGGYAPVTGEEEEEVEDSDSESDESSEDSLAGPNSEETLNLNERRTRRGVYTITSKKGEDSDESDEEEGDDVVPLADAPDIPADIELTTEAGTPSSELTSLNSPSPAGTGPSTPKTPFRSIISTRLQNIHRSTTGRETPQKQLVTPPASEESQSPKRVTRSSSSSKGKEKEYSSTPSARPRGRPPKNAKKDEIQVKKEEAEPRLLRARPSPAIVESAKDPPAKPEIPKGPDGKPLPLCVTCRSILPVISVDSQVVWGLGLENASKKKRTKLECPRCLRHSAIYGQPWPGRTPGAGSLPTPREDSVVAESSKRVTKHSLSAVDRKLAAAAKTRKREMSPEPPSKRRKIEAPSVKLSKTASKTFLSNRKRHSLPAPPPTEKRKRGRPRLTSPRAQKTRVVSVTAAGQPRAQNGRFDRKSRGGRRTSMLNTPSKSAPVSLVKSKPKDENTRDDRPPGCRTSPRRKRTREDEPEDNSRRKSPKREVEDNKDEEEEASPKKALPRPLSSFRGGKLFSTPNPLSFALKAWAGPVILDDPSSAHNDDSATNEDKAITQPSSIPATITTTAVEPAPAPAEPLPISSPARGILTYKPSPTNFARRRWLPPPTVEKAPSEQDTKQTPEQTRTRRVSLVYATVSCTHILDDKASMLNVDPNACNGDLVHVYPPSVKKVPDVYTTKAFKESTNEVLPKPNLVNAGWDDGDQSDY